MNMKKKSTIILWISIILIFTNLSLYIIGCNSSFLINNTLKYVALGLLIFGLLVFGIDLFILIKFHKKRGFNKVVTILVYLICIIYGGLNITGLVLLYGPNKDFENWLVTTAMQTLNHKHYCKWFYSEEEIAKVMSENTIEEIIEDTDTSLIVHEEKKTYENEYERAILEREDGALYKIIRFKVNDCDAFLAAIYDPSRIHIGVTKDIGKSGHYVTRMAQEQNAILAINGGGFFDPNYSSNGANPLGVTIADGKIVTDNNYNSNKGLIGFDVNDNLILRKKTTADEAINMGIRDAVTMGPFLIVNGKSSFIRGNGGWGLAARTAIGQRADGIVLFLVVDSNEIRSKGASMYDLTEIMENYGAVNAANLDGGTSSVMVENGELLNDPIDSALRHKTRPIPTFFKVV